MKRKKKQHRQVQVEQLQPVRKKAYWAILVAVVLAGVPFGLGKYMELSLPGPYDSGSYVQSAKHILEGGRLGVDEVSLAKPGTLLVNIVGVGLFGYNDVGPKVMQGLMQICAFALMFYTMRRLYGEGAAIVGVVVAAFFLSAPVICKYGNVKEQFMIAMMIVGACCFMLRQNGGRVFWMVAAGAVIVNIYYFKATGLSVAIAIMLYLLVQVCMKKISLKGLYLEFWLLIGGAVLGLIPLGIFHLQQGAFGAYIKTLPFVMVRFGIGVLFFCGVCYWVIAGVKGHGLLSRIREQVRWQVWAIGGGAVLVFLAGWMVVFALKGGIVSDGFDFLYDVPFISVPLGFFCKVTAVFDKIHGLVSSSGGYVSSSRAARSYSQQAGYVFRYYSVLKLPVILACVSILMGVLRLIKRKVGKVKEAVSVNDWLLLFVGLWWLLDMAFVWISPRPYEQYYLPLCASGAVLSGYVVWLWSEKWKASSQKIPWILGGGIAVLCMVFMAWPVYAGITHSPYSGRSVKETYGVDRYRGYVQQLEKVKKRKSDPDAWEAAGRYIKDNSAESDRIYVWGWMPGIYVEAQRLSAYRVASESDMHVMPPRKLRINTRLMLRDFRANPPEFIVDTRKIHYPNDRPPLELWPHRYAKDKRYGDPIPNTPGIIAQYDALYKRLLEEKFDPRQKEYNHLLGTTCWINKRPWTKAMPDETKRYEYMGNLRQFIRDNYLIVPNKQFGGRNKEIVVFERKN